MHTPLCPRRQVVSARCRGPCRGSRCRRKVGVRVTVRVIVWWDVDRRCRVGGGDRSGLNNRVRVRVRVRGWVSIAPLGYHILLRMCPLCRGLLCCRCCCRRDDVCRFCRAAVTMCRPITRWHRVWFTNRMALVPHVFDARGGRPEGFHAVVKRTEVVRVTGLDHRFSSLDFFGKAHNIGDRHARNNVVAKNRRVNIILYPRSVGQSFVNARCWHQTNHTRQVQGKR